MSQVFHAATYIHDYSVKVLRIAYKIDTLLLFQPAIVWFTESVSKQSSVGFKLRDPNWLNTPDCKSPACVFPHPLRIIIVLENSRVGITLDFKFFHM